MRHACPFLALVIFTAAAYADDPKPMPIEVTYEDWQNKAKPEFKEKYDGKPVKFMGVADWEVKKVDGKTKLHLTRLYYVPMPKDADPKAKKQIAKAEIEAYLPNGAQAESELAKWKPTKWKCEFLIEGTMKVGDEIAIQDGTLKFIHRVPKGK